MLDFQWIYAFFLLPTPLLYYFFTSRIKHNYLNNEPGIIIPRKNQFGVLQNYQQLNFPGNSKLLRFLLILLWLLTIIGLARPQFIGEAISVSRSGRDIILAIDLSYSMRAEDFHINNRVVDRLSASKWVAHQFIEQRAGDRLGLILFADKAYTQTPLTFDLKTLQAFLAEAAIGLVGKQTAIGDAIVLAAKKLSSDKLKSNGENNNTENQTNKKRVLILLTDGENNAGNIAPLTAARLAADLGLRIYPISIGPEFIQSNSFFGHKIPRKEYADEKTLQEIARITGGKHFFAGNTDELIEVYNLLNKLEPIKYDDIFFSPKESLAIYPLSLALFICLVILFLRR